MNADGTPTDFALKQYKGNCGKVAVIGGSEEYTGAPYYAAIAALRTGADLSHVFCPPQALTPIKCYSPEVIVHPLNLDSEREVVKQLTAVAKTLVFGPGLGRSKESYSIFKGILTQLTY